MMKSEHAVFKSRQFQIEPGEDGKTNPGIYGKALAKWILEKLRARGLEVGESVVAEDFGWLVMLKGHPFSLWVGCSSIEETPDEWQLVIGTDFGWLSRLLRRGDPSEAISALHDHLDAILRENPEISDIEWD